MSLQYQHQRPIHPFRGRLALLEVNRKMITIEAAAEADRPTHQSTSCQTNTDNQRRLTGLPIEVSNLKDTKQNKTKKTGEHELSEVQSI